MHTPGVLSLPVAAVFVAAILRAQGPPAPVGINDLIRLAIENNRELAALRQRLPEARGLLRQAGARLAPTLQFSGTTGRPLRTVGEEQYAATWKRWNCTVPSVVASEHKSRSRSVSPASRRASPPPTRSTGYSSYRSVWIWPRRSPPVKMSSI